MVWASKRSRPSATAQIITAFLAVLVFAVPSHALAWGAKGHRTVAAIAADLLPPAKVAQMDALLKQLEADKDFIDAASYPDEYVRDHDPQRKFSPWHYSNLPDAGPFTCGVCLYSALDQNLKIIEAGGRDYKTAVALAWVIHLVGDIHQPLHASGKLAGGGGFPVTYRGQSNCPGATNVQLHKVWDDCLVEEASQGKAARDFAKDLLGSIRSYEGRSELGDMSGAAWERWGSHSRDLANSDAFDGLRQHADLQDAYIGPAKTVVRAQLLTAGIRLAWLLDHDFH
jgi:hypothetical protein